MKAKNCALLLQVRFHSLLCFLLSSRMSTGGNTAGGKTAAVIWLHGLGDCGASWQYLETHMRSPHVKWVFPDAPEQPVSCNGGFEMPSW